MGSSTSSTRCCCLSERPRRWACGAAIALLLTTGARLQAQDGPPTGAVGGRVVSAATGSAIEGAVVAVLGTAAQATSRTDGRFVLAEVPSGIVRLRVVALGYRPTILADVVVSPGRTATVEVRMTAQPVELRELVVAPSYFASPADAPTSTQALRGEEIRRAPGTQEDVIRTVALLPGVGVTSPARNDLVVRGGAPFENLFLVDNLPVADLNHFGTQGSTGGPVSLVNLDLVEGVEFSSGGFGAAFGDRTGSVTGVRLREGSRDEFGGKATLSATGVGLTVEGPVAGGSAIASVRRSYLDLLFRALDFSFLPSYWDANLKASWQVGPRDRLAVVGLGALDRIAFTNATAEDRRDNGRIPSLDQDQFAVGATWTRTGERSRLDVTLGRTGIRFRTSQRDSLLTEIFSNRSTEAASTLRLTWSRQLGPRWEARLGGTGQWHDALRYDITLPGPVRRDAEGVERPLRVDTSFTATRLGGHAELTHRWGADGTITLGGRVDRYGFLDGAVRAAPRVAASIPIAPGTAVTASAGRYWQAPSFIWLVGDPGNPDRLEPFRVDAIVAGIQRAVRPDLKLQLEVYHKRYARYPARRFRPQAVLAPTGFGDVQSDIPFGLEPLESSGTGRAYGAELFLQKRLSQSPVYGLVSLAVARSEFTGLDGITRPGAFDTRLLGTVAAGWRPNARWELGAKFRLATGQPTTPWIESGPLRSTLDFGRYNAGPRLPTFHALDLRIDRRWSWRGAQLVGYLDIQNVYGRANVSRVEWNDEFQEPRFDEGIGTLPSIGLSIAW